MRGGEVLLYLGHFVLSLRYGKLLRDDRPRGADGPMRGRPIFEPAVQLGIL